MGRLVVINGRELNMNAGFIEPNSEWSVTVGEEGSVEVNRLDLKEENAKLRDQLEEQKCFAADLERDVRALRELVLDMWPHVRHRSRMCGECELPCDTSDECLLYEPMRQRMRKLGVEVES